MDIKQNIERTKVEEVKEMVAKMLLGLALVTSVIAGAHLWATDQRLDVTIAVKPRYTDTQMPQYEDLPAVSVCIPPSRKEATTSGVCTWPPVAPKSLK